MALSIFENKSEKPDDFTISEALGDAKILWDAVKTYVCSKTSANSEEWKHYGKSSGWTLLLKHKKKTILYLFPNKACFIVLFVFGEKAIESAKASGLPSFIIAKIEEATPYMEGRSFQIEVKSEDDFAHIKKLIDIKMNSYR